MMNASRGLAPITTMPAPRSQLRRRGGIAMLVMCAATVLVACGSPTSSSPPTPATPKPTPAAPTPPPVSANNLVSAMVNQMGTAQPMRVQFNGNDKGGSLSFDVVTDGQGNLSGTYVRQGQTAQIIIAGGSIYMNGGAVIASFTGLPVIASATGWYQLPAPISGEVLDTIASAPLLRACLSTITGASYGYTGSLTVAGIKAAEIAPSGGSWQYAIPTTGASNLVAMQLVSGGNYEPACNGGVIDQGPRSGTTGLFSFSNFGTPVSVTAPASFSPLRDPDPAAQVAN